MIEQAYNTLLDDELPPAITEPEETWRCDYCAVRSICAKIAQGDKHE
jgi:hypothetical protein